MFAEKENLLHAGPVPHAHLGHGPGKAGLQKTPMPSKAFPKTPLKVPLNDDMLGGMRMPMTTKKSVFANRNLGAKENTPMAGKSKLGIELKTPAPGQQTTRRPALTGKSVNARTRRLTPTPSLKHAASKNVEAAPAPVVKPISQQDELPEPETIHPAPPELPYEVDGIPRMDYAKMKDFLYVNCMSYYMQNVKDEGTKKFEEWEAKWEKEAEEWKNGRESPVKFGRVVMGKKADVNKKVVPKTEKADGKAATKPAAPKFSTIRPRSVSGARPPVSSNNTVKSRPTSSMSNRRPPVSGLNTKPPTTRPRSASGYDRPTKSTLNHSTSRPSSRTSSRPPSRSGPLKSAREPSVSSTKRVPIEKPAEKPVQIILIQDEELEELEKYGMENAVGRDVGEVEVDVEEVLKVEDDEFFLEL